MTAIKQTTVEATHCPLCASPSVRESIIENAAVHKRKTCTNCRWGVIKAANRTELES